MHDANAQQVVTGFHHCADIKLGRQATAFAEANILTIHQSIPVNGVATLTLSVEVRENTGNVSSMIEELEVLDGIHYVKILARE